MEQPDPYSRTEGEEGRRIVRLDDHRPWGWRIVNHEKYRRIRSEEERREYQALWIANKRQVVKENVDSCRQLSTAVDNVDPCSMQYADAVSIKQKERGAQKPRSSRASTFPDGFELTDEMRAFAIEQGIEQPNAEFAKFRDYHTAKGSRFANWKAAWRNWVRRSINFGKRTANQRVGGPTRTESGGMPYLEPFPFRPEEKKTCATK